MTKSHRHQQIGLYTALVERARQGLPGLSIGTMELMFNFDNKEQVQHALDALVVTGHITIDIGGRYPSMRLLKDRYKALHNRGRALTLSSGAPRPGVDTKPVAVGANALESELVTAPAPAPSVVPQRPLPPSAVRSCCKSFENDPDHRPDCSTISAVVAAVRMEPAAPIFVVAEASDPQVVSFTLTDIEWVALGEACDRHEHPILLPAFAKRLCLTELDRLLSADGPKHKLTADVIRAAREEGRDLGEFVTSIIAVGMKAREMNRKGI